MTLTKADKVQLTCSSEKVLAVPQNPAANATLVATRVGSYQNQGAGAR
ncbi:hypothetical protein ACWCQK_08590 [Streptomyces sp. NPDC002306]